MKRKCTYSSHKGKLAKLWHFLWHEESLASFAADAILIVLIGKFLLYPAVGAMMGNDYPIVAVISHSMDHKGLDFDDWWVQNGKWYEDLGVSKSDFEQYYLKDGFKKGDVLFIKGRAISDLSGGDIIVYAAPFRGEPIIHRIVSVSEDGSSVATKGDANSAQLGFENSINEDQIYGEAVFLIPKIGWVKVSR